MVEVGDTAPVFCLPGEDEREICLKDYQGRWLVLYFYPKDNTSGCTREALDFSFDYLEGFQEEANQLINTELTQSRFRELIEKEFGAPRDAHKVTVSRTENKLDQMEYLFADSDTHEGMRKRYGFIYVNRDEFDMLDLGRYRKDSFFWYQQVSATNGENLADIV